MLGPKVKGPAAQPANVEEWKERLADVLPNSAPNVQASNHYALLYWDAPAKEVADRLLILEGNFRAFYLLNALRGTAPAVPERSLVAVLPPQTRDAWNLIRAMNGRSVATDAFYSPEYGALVLGPGRLDEVGHSFQRLMGAAYSGGASSPDLLRGKGPKIDPKNKMPAATVAYMMTMAAVEKYSQDDAEWAAAGREGTRQILFAVGALPRHVALPRWLENGLGSLFERPRGPVFTHKEAEPHMTLSLYRGPGAPNFVMLKDYRDLAAADELNKSPEALLRNVLANAYFEGAQAGVNVDPPRPGAAPPAEPESPQEAARLRARVTEMLVAKANATAWALAYFLAQAHLNDLYRLGAELDRLPFATCRSTTPASSWRSGGPST